MLVRQIIQLSVHIFLHVLSMAFLQLQPPRRPQDPSPFPLHQYSKVWLPLVVFVPRF
jgi:hypothetical protein